MKKLLLAICCLISLQGIAQITYGAKLGVNVSKMDEIHTGSEKRIAMFAGGFVSIPLQDYGEQFYIQPEIMYSMMGEKEFDSTESQEAKDVNIDYIIVPVLFKAFFSEQDTEFFGEIGPQFGFLVNKKLPVSDEEYDYNTFDYGATLGIGLSYLRTWEASARFYYGLADVVDGQNSSLGKDPKNINSNVSFGIAYVF